MTQWINKETTTTVVRGMSDERTTYSITKIVDVSLSVMGIYKSRRRTRFVVLIQNSDGTCSEQMFKNSDEAHLHITMNAAMKRLAARRVNRV